MNQNSTDIAVTSVTEVVGRFADREAFARTVRALLDAGFAHADLSVLDTHEPLSASESSEEARKSWLAGLTGEITYVGPITIAGLIMIASGPIGALAAGAVGAGVAGAAIRELLAEIDATSRTQDFAEALANGAALLWVRADTDEAQVRARAVMETHGAEDVHVHTRKTA
ncbi:MAG: hypothetical protein GVY13_11915 [Alphaproteobacteria bacterium]|nr:hypothetical protein [Alphaproteobacteria bacterium]